MLTVADLFCGAGGFSLGFLRAGFTPLFALDNDPWACKTYDHNIGPHSVMASIEDLKARKKDREIIWNVRGNSILTPAVTALVGGPPCQGFSRLNRDASEDDPRNELWAQYFRLLRCIEPDVFVIENVPQLLTSDQFRRLMRRARDYGYTMTHGILNAADFGIPQNRRRAFVIGIRGRSPSLPQPNGTLRTVASAFKGLSLQPQAFGMHIARDPTPLSRERYAHIPPGGNRFDLPEHLLPDCWRRKRTGTTDVFGRMHYDKPSPTIRTEFLKPEKGRYLHPIADRPITLREGARLQTFPDSYKFFGSNTQVARQIGNAVPIDLAYQIALNLKSDLSEEHRLYKNQ